MNDAFCVSRGETVSDLQGVVDYLSIAEWSIGETFTHGFAFEEFVNNKRKPVVQSDVVDGENVWVIQTTSGACFLFKALQSF